MNDEIEPESTSEPKAPGPWRGLPGWKRALVVLSVLAMVAGLAWQGLGSSSTPSESASRRSLRDVQQPDATGSRSLTDVQIKVGDGDTQVAVADEPTVDGSGESGTYAPFLWKGGASLFVGFCIGYALRTFFKVSALAIGFALLCVCGLAYLGVLEVDWQGFEELFDKVAAKVAEEGQQFQTFLTGSLPSAALGSFGLYAGFRRSR